MPDRLRAVLIGAGKMGLGYAEDPIMARHFRYASHAQVLAAHDRFTWLAVVDPSEEALEAARRRWGVSISVPQVQDLPTDLRPDVAILATPPGVRADIIDRLPGLRAVLVEKPLGNSLSEAEGFTRECAARGIVAQVNLWRRADPLFRRLAGGALKEMIGATQAVFGLYGNGLVNNGTHMVDFLRMLVGEATTARLAPGASVRDTGPLPGDVLVPFSVELVSGATAMFQPLAFRHYRENALDIWGERGRVSILQEGLLVQHFPRADNRAMQGEGEVASDRPEPLVTTAGDALYHMYTDLADALETGTPVCSSMESALETTRLIDRVLQDARAS